MHRLDGLKNVSLLRRHMSPRVFGLALLAGLAFPLVAVGEEPAAGQDSTALTIYSSAAPGGVPVELYRPGAGGYGGEVPGYAVVRQERGFDLTAGRNVIRFTDVAAQIDPTTVQFISLTAPEATRVIEQSYEFDLVSADKLMERYLDKVVTFEQANGESIQTYTGTLLSTNGGIVLKDDAGRVQVLRGYTNARFPELPGGLITRPTLVWDVATQQAGGHRTRVAYQTTGITWWADYNVTFAPGKDANSGVLDIGAWVSIVNQSGAGYPDAKLKLVAGDVHRAPPPPSPKMLMRSMAAPAEADMGAAGFEEKAFFEYHLYTLGRPTTIPDRSTKQIELFPAAHGVPCEKAMVYEGQAYTPMGGLFTERDYGSTGNKKVDIFLEFKNEEAIGMGMPLPAGRIRVSQLDNADGSLEFIGEDTIDHTPRNELVRIKLGSAFDVVGERNQVDFKIDTRRKTMDETIEIKLRNRKTEPVKVVAREVLFRWMNWEIADKSQDFEKVGAQVIHFPVTLNADEEKTIRYRVHYSW